MTHNRKAFTLIEVSIYLFLITVVGTLTFVLISSFTQPMRALYTKTADCCVAYTSLQLLRSDLSAARSIQINSPYELSITQDTPVVWRYEPTAQTLTRIRPIHQMQRITYDRSLVLTHLTAWQVRLIRLTGVIGEYELHFTHAGHLYSLAFFVPQGPA